MANAILVSAGVLLLLAMLSVRDSIHSIQEGHVGVYYRGGALLSDITDPGLHFKIPFITKVESVQVTVQTDRVTNIPCGTSGGVMIYFEAIEVINFLKRGQVYDTIKNYTVHYDKTWIYDRIHHSVNQFCSRHTLQEVYIDLFDTIDDKLVEELQRDCNQWAPGIHIIGCRVTKPKIPSTILHNYELMEAEKTKFLIQSQKQHVIEKEAETERLRQTIEAEMVKQVAQIRMSQEIMEKESVQKIAAIEDEMHLDHQKALTDAAFYQQTKEAEANQQKLTPEFLVSESIRALANNSKVYFGERIPTMFAQQSLSPSDVQAMLTRARSN